MANEYTVIPPEKYLQQIWKNGRGSTSQILILPEECDFKSGNFIFRASSAELKENGFFSNFSGLERMTMVIAGKGLKLKTATTQTILAPFHKFQFSGDIPTEYELIDGPIIDFNLFWNPKLIKVKYEMILIPKGGSWGWAIGERVKSNFFIASGELLQGQVVLPRFHTICSNDHNSRQKPLEFSAFGGPTYLILFNYQL